MSEKEIKKGFDLDLILKEIGDFGLFQIKNYLLICIPIALTAMYTFNYVFTAADLEYRCKIAGCEPEDTSMFFNNTFLNYSIPREGNSFASCKQFEMINKTLSETEDLCSPYNFNETSQVECHKFVYRGDEKTIMNEWDLTCPENEWKLSLVGTINNVGQFVALPLGGYISDNYGRRTALIFFTVISGVMGLIKSFSINYEMFISFEFIESALGSGAYASGFLLGMELVGPTKRVIGIFFINCSYVFGSCLLALIAMATKEWRAMLQWAYTPSIFIFIYFWLIPESVRWLVTRGRQREAADILFKAATTNKVDLSLTAKDILLHHGDEEIMIQNAVPKIGQDASLNSNIFLQEIIEEIKPKKQYPILTLLKSSLLLRFVICSFCWMTNAFVYYGLVLNSVSLAGSKYFNFILISLVEIPAFIICWLTADRFGRKKVLCGALLLSGIACFSQLFLTENTEGVKLFLFLLGKLSITVSFTILYVYTAEIFPTELRHSLLGLCSMLGRIGSIVAPQTPLLGKYVESLPMILFGSTAVAAGLMILQFPETLNTVLPDTVKQAEDVGTKKQMT